MIENPTKRPAIVTGASKGIGRAICIELARCGFYPIVNYRSDKAGAEKTLALVAAAGGQGEIMGFDVTDFEAVQSAVGRVIAAHGTIAALVHNAGITADELFVMMSRRKWHAVIDTSLNGFYNITRPVLEKMVVQKKGAIVAIASVSALMINRGQANYAAAKAGLIGAARTVAAEVGRLGV
ncbi:MAG: SDR family NAD(P)-dependent oxidoreductase, partial [Desulfobacterales bacterium]